MDLLELRINSSDIITDNYTLDELITKVEYYYKSTIIVTFTMDATQTILKDKIDSYFKKNKNLYEHTIVTYSNLTIIRVLNIVSYNRFFKDKDICGILKNIESRNIVNIKANKDYNILLQHSDIDEIKTVFPKYSIDNIIYDFLCDSNRTKSKILKADHHLYYIKKSADTLMIHNNKDCYKSNHLVISVNCKRITDTNENVIYDHINRIMNISNGIVANTFTVEIQLSNLSIMDNSIPDKIYNCIRKDIVTRNVKINMKKINSIYNVQGKNLSLFVMNGDVLNNVKRIHVNDRFCMNNDEDFDDKLSDNRYNAYVENVINKSELMYILGIKGNHIIKSSYYIEADTIFDINNLKESYKNTSDTKELCDMENDFTYKLFKDRY